MLDNLYSALCCLDDASDGSSRVFRRLLQSELYGHLPTARLARQADKSAWTAYTGKIGKRKGQKGWKHRSGKVVWGDAAPWEIAEKKASDKAKAHSALESRRDSMMKSNAKSPRGGKSNSTPNDVVAAAREKVSGGSDMKQQATELAQQLLQFTGVDLEAFKKANGIKASGNKSVQAQKIAERILTKSEPLAKTPEKPTQKKTATAPKQSVSQALEANSDFKSGKLALLRDIRKAHQGSKEQFDQDILALAEQEGSSIFLHHVDQPSNFSEKELSEFVYDPKTDTYFHGIAKRDSSPKPASKPAKSAKPAKTQPKRSKELESDNEKLRKEIESLKQQIQNLTSSNT